MEDDSGASDGPRARHLFATEHAPWDWTCEQCGYAVKAGSRLEHLISNVQTRRAIGAGFLAGLGDLLERWRTGGRVAQAVATTAGVVAIVAVAAAWSVTRQTPSEVPRTAATSGPTAVRTAVPRSTDLSAIARATDGGALAGRNVDLDAVVVESVTGDVTFWIGSSRTDRTFVVLDETAESEVRVKVREGQKVRIAGTLERTPVEGVELTAADERSLGYEVLYVHARSVEIVGR